MMTVAQVSKITGVSVRTLHHYDAIGLLKPDGVTESGYRLYGEEALKKLQAILLFRQLEFPLKEIRQILESPDFDAREALEQQIRLLELRRQQLDKLIAHAREIQNNGGQIMDFSAYDQSQYDRYAAQAKEKWGATQAYREFEEKTAGTSLSEQKAAADALMDIFRELGQLRHLSPGDREVQTLIKKLQDFITGNYYTCTPQILKGLGQMYAAGGEMTENIDRAGGAGTGAFAQRAIDIYFGK